jgi:hypothetical protein
LTASAIVTRPRFGQAAVTTVRLRSGSDPGASAPPTRSGSFLSHIKVDPDFMRLRDNPRFKAMIAAADARLAAENYG